MAHKPTLSLIYFLKYFFILLLLSLTTARISLSRPCRLSPSPCRGASPPPLASGVLLRQFPSILLPALGLLLCRPHPLPMCRAPNLGSSMHHVSVPGSVADTHNSNKIDIRNHTFIANGKTHYIVRVYIAWAIGLISYIKVLRQRSYIIMALFLQATWSADVTLDLFLKRIPISHRRSSSVASSCSRTVPSSSILWLSYPCVVLDSSILVRSPIVLSSRNSNSSIRVCAPVALLLKT